MSEEQNLTLEQLLVEFRDESRALSASTADRLSGLDSDEIGQLRDAWPTLPAARRRQLLTRLKRASEDNFELDFSAITRLALRDDDAQVRWLAIAGLWEDNTPWLQTRLTGILNEDESAEVRAKAAAELGRFVLLGELGKLPSELVAPVEETLLQVYQDASEPLDVHRRALESLSYSSREEMKALIEEAYYHNDLHMKASAVFSMGRSCDDYWAGYVLEELESGIDELRFEAARAAGELQLSESLLLLIDLLESDDVEIRGAAIWSLGEIGGAQARAALNEAAESVEDESLLEDIEDALATADLAEGLLGLMELSNDDL